jgi:hypothetical protein
MLCLLKMHVESNENGQPQGARRRVIQERNVSPLTLLLPKLTGDVMKASAAAMKPSAMTVVLIVRKIGCLPDRGESCLKGLPKSCRVHPKP